ncbi:MAG: hypothetical protein Q9M15_09265 [Mariprofundaceae bacterium]|nr:hypothetical protein [Mariprofundaceae bacterium]
MNINIKNLVARVRHADAVLAKLSEPENKAFYRSILSQCSIPEDYHCVQLYTVEVALAHLIPTVMFLKVKLVDDDEMKDKVVMIRNALAHAGEYIPDNKPNVELTEQGGVIFRTRNNGGKEIVFNTIIDLSEFISEINKRFADAL